MGVSPKAPHKVGDKKKTRRKIKDSLKKIGLKKRNDSACREKTNRPGKKKKTFNPGGGKKRGGVQGSNEKKKGGVAELEYSQTPEKKICTNRVGP